ncbi:MAG: acyltransferase [Desulfuromonadaceae bacterium]|nr:acyltransferase [Desulfuromonadaceae bacterium]MDD5106895.1 acyltransferase [Desulfuromonadaceae bacterium]
MHLWIKWLISKTSRDTTSGQFIAEVDGLRFIAIFSVILFHLNWFITSKTRRPEGADFLTEFLSNGHIGVQLFFVISGFVIALPFAKGHLLNGRLPKLQQFFLRRMTRLEPPYIVNLLFRFAFLPLATAETLGELFPHLLTSMVYLHNIIYGSMSEINFVAWSLEIELQFYLLAPFVTLVFMIRSKIGRRLLIASLIIIFSIIAYTLSGFPRGNLSILSAAQYFLTGFLLVDIYLIDWEQNPTKSWRWDMVSILAWPSIIALLYQNGGEFFIVIPTFFAYVAAFKGVLSNRFFCQPGIYIIGGMCYTLYLYHYSVISGIGRLLIKVEFLHHLPAWLEIIVAGLVIVPAVLLSGTIMFVMIEKPCMKKDWHIRLVERFKLGMTT